jgi:hypothetical protein
MRAAYHIENQCCVSHNKFGCSTSGMRQLRRPQPAHDVPRCFGCTSDSRSTLGGLVGPVPETHAVRSGSRFHHRRGLDGDAADPSHNDLHIGPQQDQHCASTTKALNRKVLEAMLEAPLSQRADGRTSRARQEHAIARAPLTSIECVRLCWPRQCSFM